MYEKLYKNIFARESEIGFGVASHFTSSYGIPHKEASHGGCLSAEAHKAAVIMKTNGGLEIKSIAAFPEDPGLILSIHMATHNPQLQFQGIQCSFFGLQRHQPFMWYTEKDAGETHMHTHGKK